MDLENLTPFSILDARGLTCPMPLLKTKKDLKGVPAGEILEIWGTDPGSKNDIPALGQQERKHLPRLGR